MSKIERLHYYDRQYLRDFDFTAEQTYHLEMRRRLNRALHLWGIVDGLELCRGVLVPGAPEQYFVNPGMAIDAHGREIVLCRPYPITEAELEANRIDGAGTYGVWIEYDRQLATPPAAGYQVCDLAGQYTRYREAPRVRIGNDLGRPESDVPAITGALSDDPKKEPWPILLGKVRVETPLGRPTLAAISATPGERRYVGLQAQSLVAPAADPPEDCAEDFADADLPIRAEADFQVAKDLIVGEDFGVDENLIEADPEPDLEQPGSIRAQNLFLQHNLFASVAGKWLGFKEFVQSVVPDVKVGTLTIPITPTAASPANGVETFSLTSALPAVETAEMVAWVAGIELRSLADINEWESTADDGSPVQFEVGVGTITRQPASANAYDFEITWAVGPKDNPANPADAIVVVQSIKVAYTAVFRP